MGSKPRSPVHIHQGPLEVGSKPMRNIACLLALLSAVAGGALPAWAQSAGSPPMTPSSGIPQTVGPSGLSTAAGLGVSKLALAVVQLGVLRCVERAEQVSKFLSRGSNDVLILDRPAVGNAADMVTASLLVPTEAGGHSTVQISLVPTPNGCSANYSAILHVAMKCEEAEKKLFPGLAFRPLREGSYRLALIGEVGRVLSSEAAGRCSLVKSEVIR